MFNKIIFPVVLINASNNLEVIGHSNQLKHITNLAFKKRSLIDAIIFDSNNLAYKIEDVLKIKKVNTWWKFEFFNPLLEINLHLKTIEMNFSEALDSIENAIKSYPEYWDSEDFDEVIINLREYDTLASVIQYLRKISNPI